MEIVEGEFPVRREAAAFLLRAGNFTHKKIPGAKARGIFLFHLIVIVLIQASCEVEEGRGVGGVD